MVVQFPLKPKPEVDLAEDHLAHIARTEAYLDRLLASLYAQLPDDPARYPIQIGRYVIHYRRRPRTVLTEELTRRAG